MKLKFIISILWIFYIQSFYELQARKLLQIEGTNKEIKEFFENLKIPYKSDTIFTFLISPGVAARIEPLVNMVITSLQKEGIKNDIIIFVISNKKKAGEKYLKKMNFKGDYQLVIGEEFLKFFEFKNGISKPPFIPPFLTKFSVSKGELLSSFSLWGAKIDTLNIRAFIKDFSCPKTKKIVSADLLRIKRKESKIVILKKVKLLESDEYPLSFSRSISYSPSKNYLAITDKITLSIYIFDLNTGKFINHLAPDSLEHHRFIKLPPETYSSYKELFRSMYFNHCFYNDSILLIAATLPSVEEKNEIVHYRNVACFVEKNIFSNKPLKINPFPFSFEIETLSYTFNHVDASFIPETKLIFLPFCKGSLKENLQEISLKENPFRKEFYEKDLYQFGIFNFEGEFIGFLGRLSKYFEDLKIGYSIAPEGLVKFYNEDYYTTDRYSGKIYKYDKGFNLLDSISVFEINLLIPNINYEKEPVRYALEVVEKNFYRYIVDFLVNDDVCYVLLRERKIPFLYKIDLKDSKIKKYLLPTQLKKEKINYYLLDKRNKDVVIIALLENPYETFYCEVKIAK
ncbi:MAG: hypothetical protein N2323_02095 [candidate division WOR-3 bacterium]|nr:hypothetical protein [candidate division WOR-3 bacterium]MCX7836739.1 hypothetical protein [candidate division WOR-3 bacterium]MDW8113932.1 hypothetical protein [candidate division WOR-3 bacterium]